MNKILTTGMIAFGVSLLAGCSGQLNTAQLLKDPKKKAEVIEALCADPVTASEVADQMAKTPACISTITSNNSLIRQLTSEGNLSGMLHSDTATSYNLMADLVSVSSKDSVATHRMVAYMLTNGEMRAELHREMQESKAGKEKKHKDHKDKDHKEKSGHKKGKHKDA